MRTIEGLVANGPDAELADRLALFGQFVGDWEIEAQWFLTNGTSVMGKGEAHFGWILNGTAIQDVWAIHPVDPPRGFADAFFGTTVRYYDTGVKCWRSIWMTPSGGPEQSFTGRLEGDNIVLETLIPEGIRERWVYSEITPESFRWTTEQSQNWGSSWWLMEEMKARRVGPSQPSL